MNIFQILLLIAVILLGQAVFYLIFFEKQTLARKELALVCFSLFIYALFSLLIQTAVTVEQINIYFKAMSVGFVGIPVSLTYFFFKISKNNNFLIGNIIRFYILPAYLLLLIQYFIDPSHLRILSEIDNLKVLKPNYNSLWMYFSLLNYLIAGFLSFYMIYRWIKIARSVREQKRAAIVFYALAALFLTNFISNYASTLFSVNWIVVISPVNAVIWFSFIFFAFIKLKPQLISPEILNFLIIGQMKDMVVFLNLDGKIISANQSFYDILNYTAFDLQKIDLDSLFEDGNFVKQELFKSRNPDYSNSISTIIRCKGNEELPVQVNVLYNKDILGNPIGYAILCSDYKKKLLLKEEIAERIRREKELQKIQKELEYLVEKKTLELFKANEKLKAEIFERKRVEEQIKSDLSKKNDLLQEIHHRVKNNIQMIISLINMLTSHQDIDEKSSEKLIEMGGKVRSISEVHEVFYSLPRLSKINFGSYVKKATNELYSHFKESRNVVFKLNVSEDELDIDRAIPCGIVYIELLSNALKYAFSNDEKTFRQKHNKIIEIEYYKKKNKYYLSIKDNGVGLNWLEVKNNTQAISISLVNFLIKDHLKGKINIDSINGTQISIEF